VTFRPTPRPAFAARARAGTAVLTAAATVAGILIAGAAAPAAAAPAASSRPGVSAVTAVAAGSNAVRLTWHNPRRSGRVATIVRYTTGTRAPAGPTDGQAGGRPNPTRTALTIDRLRPATHYAFALFTAYGHGRYGRRAVVRAITGPDAVWLVQPFARGGTVTVTWRAPRPATYAATIVRLAPGGRAPADPHAGTGVALTGPHATAARLTGLAPATAYAVAIWTRDRGGRYSSVATTRFTTPAPAGTATGHLAGTVTDDAAHPLAGADVLVVDGDSAASWTTKTDGTGHYALTIPAGGVTVVLSGDTATGGDGDAAGYQPDVQDVIVPSAGTKTVNGALVPGGEIDGQVTDRLGNPLAGVGVVPRPPDSYAAQSGGAFFIISFSGDGPPTTDANGRFRLRGAPPIAEQVCYEPSDAPVTGGTSDAAGYQGRCEHRAVAAGAGDVRTLASTALLPAATGTLTGVVTDSGGHPVAGVIVDAENRDPESFDGGADLTDASGHYRIGGLSPGSYDTCADPTAAPLAPGSVGNAPTCRFGVATISRAHTTVTNVILRAAGAIGGRVRATRGTPLPALVVVQSQGGPTAGIGVTDRHGQYIVGDLAPGRYRVCFLPFDTDAGGSQPGCYRDGDLVQVRRGLTRLGVDATLARGGGVSGRVSGIPLDSEVAVAAFVPGVDEPAGQTTVDASGNYVIGGLPAGHYVICAFPFAGIGDAGRCHPGSVTVRVGHVTGGVGIALPAVGTLTTTVTNEAGRPVSGVNVAVLTSCADGECGVVPLFTATSPANVLTAGMTDADGRLRLALPPSAHYAVCALTYYGSATAGDPATGYLDTCTSHGTFGVTVRAGHDTAQAFTLHPAGAVTGRVTDRAGHPLADVRVIVGQSSSSDYYDPDQLVNDGGPFDFAPSGPASEVITDADGTYVVPGVQPGKRTVCFNVADAVDVTGAAHPHGILGQCVGGAPGTQQGGTPVTVPAGATLSGVDQQLADAAVITGRVVDRSTGWPIGHVVVLVLSGTTRVIGEAETNAVGHYRVADLPPGTVRVCFAAIDHQNQCYDNVAWTTKAPPAKSTPVTITAGGTVTLKDARLRRA